MVFGFFKKEEKNTDIKWCEDLFFSFDRDKQKEIEKYLCGTTFVFPDMNSYINQKVEELEQLDKQDDLAKEDIKRVKLILLILWLEAMRDLDEDSARRIEKIKHPSLRE